MRCRAQGALRDETDLNLSGNQIQYGLLGVSRPGKEASLWQS